MDALINSDNIKVIYDEKSKQFIINDSFTYITPLIFDKSYDPSKYKAFILNNSRDEIVENSIYQVFESSKKLRIGWIFPLQALDSNKHEYAEKQYFLEFAFVALHILLEQSAFYAFTDDTKIKLLDLSKNILVLDNNECLKVTDFDINNYIPCLYMYGYTYSGIGNFIPKTIKIENKLNLTPVSNVLRDEFFITDAYENTLPMRNLLSVPRFHILYQIVEVLINKVFSNELTLLTNKLVQNPGNLLEMREELVGMLNEKQRLSKLIHKYSHIESGKAAQCIEDCNELLRCANTEVKHRDSLDFSLYAVRCLIFHNYSKIPKDKRNLLEDVNISFEEILCDILLSYRETTLST
jgi:hypothetical protein